MAKKNVGGLVEVCGDFTCKRVVIKPFLLYNPDADEYYRVQRPVTELYNESVAVCFPAGEAFIDARNDRIGAAYALACRMVVDGGKNVRIISLGSFYHEGETPEKPVKAKFTAADVRKAAEVLDRAWRSIPRLAA
jgi:hypothetical protein